MPDITMCINGQCPLARRCYRFTAKPSSRQSYAYFEFRTSGQVVLCEHFEEVWQR